MGDLKKILENKYSNILKINFKIDENNQNFGLFPKIKKSQDYQSF